MMGMKKLSEIKAELEERGLLCNLPGTSPKAALQRKRKTARADANEIETELESALAALEREVKKRRKPKAQCSAKR